MVLRSKRFLQWFFHVIEIDLSTYRWFVLQNIQPSPAAAARSQGCQTDHLSSKGIFCMHACPIERNDSAASSLHVRVYVQATTIFALKQVREEIKPDNSFQQPRSSRPVAVSPWFFLSFFLFVLPACLSCLLYTSPSPRDRQKSRMPSSA